MDENHTTQAIDFQDRPGEVRGIVTCECGEAITTDWFENRLVARRAAEAEFRKHREFRMMHVGLFEDLP